MGSGGGQVVSVLAFYSDDPSSNPVEVYNFSVKLYLKRTKKQKQPGWHIKNNKQENNDSSNILKAQRHFMNARNFAANKVL